MSHRIILVLLIVVCAALGLALAPSKPLVECSAKAQSANSTERDVFLVGKLTDLELLSLTAAVSARETPGIMLIDTPKAGPYIKNFLASYHPGQIVCVGGFSERNADLESRLGRPIAAALQSPNELYHNPRRAVVCSAKPRSLLLQAACLAGALKAPLLITQDQQGQDLEIGEQLKRWHTRECYIIGECGCIADKVDSKFTRLTNEEQVQSVYLQKRRKKGPIQTLVVTNAADKDLGRLSPLAPWIALQHDAALLTTNDAGNNTNDVVKAAIQQPQLAHAESLILVAGLKAIPTEHRPNPVPGKDATIEMEPLTPADTQPFSFAVGRLFHEDLGVFSLMLARQRLLAEEAHAPRVPRRAMVVSNPGGGLALLETFSRNTANELRNCGFQTTARFENQVEREEVQRLLPSQDIFLWEGHYRTMVDKFEMPKWTEPLSSSLIFLQSCLALNEAEAQPLFQRGAIGVVGSATRTFSGSGGAFTLAFFDALFYDDQSLGGGLRQAKNFLLAYSQLKKQMIGDKAKLTGANLRSAWAFTLWGDPTLKLPRPEPVANALEPIRYEVQANSIIWSLPDTTYAKVSAAPFQAQTRPNARLAGLLIKDVGEDEKRLVPFLFAEVHFPKAKSGKTPRLSSRLPARHWVFSWDERRKCGYLLVAPRPKDEREVRFHVSWES